jgi:hypothetical protein
MKHQVVAPAKCRQKSRNPEKEAENKTTELNSTLTHK